MIDALIFLSARPIVIALALVGAGLVVAGSLTAKPKKAGDRTGSDERQRPLSRGLTKAGYTLTGFSMLLFIVAGFISDLSSSPD
ncbi:MAG: hypothetical protein ACRBM6_36855 [Geminicoccales bacterium]